MPGARVVPRETHKTGLATCGCTWSTSKARAPETTARPHCLPGGPLGWHVLHSLVAFVWACVLGPPRPRANGGQCGSRSLRVALCSERHLLTCCAAAPVVAPVALSRVRRPVAVRGKAHVAGGAPCAASCRSFQESVPSTCPSAARALTGSSCVSGSHLHQWALGPHTLGQSGTVTALGGTTEPRTLEQGCDKGAAIQGRVPAFC